MNQTEGGRAADSGAAEPIGDDRDGGPPSGEPQPSTGGRDDPPASDDQSAIDLDSVHDRAS